MASGAGGGPCSDAKKTQRRSVLAARVQEKVALLARGESQEEGGGCPTAASDGKISSLISGTGVIEVVRACYKSGL